MKKQLIIMVVAVATLVTSSAYAEGCLKGAAVGGVAGHVLGKHAVIGAVSGCLVGRHMAKKDREEKDKQEQIQRQQQQSQPLPNPQGQTQPQIITNNQVTNR